MNSSEDLPQSLADLQDMQRAVGFAAQLLRDELGPGGLMEREPDAAKAVWHEAISLLETTHHHPMIPLHMWRRGDGCECKTGPQVQP